MLWCIFMPILVYALVRNHRPSAAYIYRQNKLFSIILVAFVIALAIAKQRDIILSHGTGLLASLVITMLCFSCYMAFGWLVTLRCPPPERITFAACSCFNNAALGVSLALLHFPPDVTLFVAVSEMVWSLLPIMFRHFLQLVGRA
jgi:predicted Na+-dependent transporter